MSKPVLLAVAHGSKHPEARETVSQLARQVTRLAPVLDVQVAYVQDSEPSLAAGLAAAGTSVVIVPLLLSTGYHLTTDIADAASAAGVAVAPPLGPDQLLVTALAGRLAETGVPAGTPVVLAAAARPTRWRLRTSGGRRTCWLSCWTCRWSRRSRPRARPRWTRPWRS